MSSCAHGLSDASTLPGLAVIARLVRELIGPIVVDRPWPSTTAHSPGPRGGDPFSLTERVGKPWLIKVLTHVRGRIEWWVGL